MKTVITKGLGIVFKRTIFILKIAFKNYYNYIYFQI